LTLALLAVINRTIAASVATLEKTREAFCKDRPHIITGAAPAFFGAPKNTVSAEMMQWWTDMLLQCSMRVLLELHRVFTTTDFRPDLRAISLPTLIENAAHGLPITHADRLNHDLLAYASS
jgi:non-heme chloroperoxidase